MRPTRSTARRFGVAACVGLVALSGSSAIADTSMFASRFSLRELDALIAQSPVTNAPVTSLAELVPLLPDELRQNFTFVYQSRSPFAASITPDRPRVILFSEDASFIATFIGDPNAAGHDVVETLTFDEAQARFVPGVRVLPAAAKDSAGITTDGCAQCHGQDTRPIYDSYPLWPGFYGSVQDTFPKNLPASTREYEDYVRFLRTEAKKGVYAALRWVKGSRVSPFTPPEEFKVDVLSSSVDRLRYEPNTRFGMALGDLNRMRIYRKLKTGPGFAGHERAWLSLLLDCRERNFSETEKRIDKAVRSENAARLVRLGADPRKEGRERFQMQELNQVHNLALLDELARRAGVSRRDWSMAMEPDALSFYDGILGGMIGKRSYYLDEELVLELLRDLSRTSPQFEHFFVERASFGAYGYVFGRKPDLVRATASCVFLRDEVL